jgi:hypothetical protein
MVLITNNMGQLVAKYEDLVIGEVAVNTSGIRSGFYLITFYNKNGDRLTQKLIKQ